MFLSDDEVISAKDLVGITEFGQISMYSTGP